MLISLCRVYYSICKRTYSVMSVALKPPEHVRGLKELDKAAFTLPAKISYISVDSNRLSEYRSSMKKILLKIPNFKPIQEDPDNANKKICFLDPVQMTKNIPDKLHDIVKDVCEKEVAFTYDNWTADDILKAVLPEEDQLGGAGYAIVGHIIHLNLRDHLGAYKTFIGNLLLDKVKGARLVVNKVAAIESTYRNFSMEVLAGDPSESTVVTVRENGRLFQFDFAKVYWNPRLSTEHERVINALNEGDVLFDVCAGVGPFSVPAAKKKVKVFANDLNPHSFEWLEKNFTLNKTTACGLYNLDGRQFIRTVIAEQLPKYCTATVVMNLPSVATTFLNEFVGSLEPTDENVSVRIYCYCFTPKNETEAAKTLVREGLQLADFDESRIAATVVRTVAPNKVMVRTVFQLGNEELCRRENAAKKIKLND